MSRDYFIKPEGISAYTINAFVEAIVEATKAGQSIDQDSARRIGMSFSCSFSQTPEETAIETEASVQEETSESPEEPKKSTEEPADPVKPDLEEYEGRTKDTEGVIKAANKQPFTMEDIEQAKDSMADLNKLAEPVGLSARSKKELTKLLKEYINA